jgi:hypothetical protein
MYIIKDKDPYRTCVQPQLQLNTLVTKYTAPFTLKINKVLAHRQPFSENQPKRL